ncbi:CvpA family protein [Blattabacterium cuenoti]|uniref:CvpA family protein n=1 Tax=Blattabacterium cuenoti TaxID=1653831 RepID=UPI00163BBCB1|nr:CvpA family protein [Blattabacterium cuenoti]
MLVLDIIIIILVLYGGYHGYQKGLISQFFVFMIFFILISKGIYIYHFISELLKKVINKESYLLTTVYSLIISFFSIIIVSFLSKKIIEFIIMMTCMKPMDRLCGIILGMIKYFFYLSICIFLLKEANKKIDIIPYNFFQNSFEKEFQFFFYRKGSLLNKLKELYFYFQILFL